MLTAIIILSLLSLLVATEADPGRGHVDVPGDEPLRPERKSFNPKDKADERIAA